MFNRIAMSNNEMISLYLGNAVVPDYQNDWNALMEAANRLNEICRYESISFAPASYDIEIVFENVVETIKLLNKNERPNH